MRCAAIRHDASTYMHGRIVTDRNATDEKRIRVGRALALPLVLPLRVSRLNLFVGTAANVLPGYCCRTVGLFSKTAASDNVFLLV